MEWLVLAAAGGLSWLFMQPKVPDEIDQQVKARVNECMQVLYRTFPLLNLPEPPRVKYVRDLKNRATGRARKASYNGRTNTIKLDVDKLQKYLDIYLKQIIPHECAHVVEETAQPEASHEWWWRRACEALGIEPILHTPLEPRE